MTERPFSDSASQSEDVTIDDAVLRVVVNDYTREAGVRHPVSTVHEVLALALEPESLAKVA